MKVGDIVKYKFRYNEDIGLVVTMGDLFVDVYWSHDGESILLSEVKEELEVVQS